MRTYKNPSKRKISTVNQQNIYESLDLTYREISAKSLTPITHGELIRAKDLSELIALPLIESIVLSVLVIRYETKSMISEHEITNFLWNVLMISRREVRNTLRELKRLSLVTNFKETSEIYWYPSRNVVDAIDKNSIDFFKALRPIGLEKILDYWVNTILEPMHIQTDEIEEALEECKSNNANINLIKYIENLSIFQSGHEAACLMSICSRSLFSSRPFNIAYFEQKSLFSRYHLATLRQSIHDGEWKPMKDNYVKITGGRITRDEVRLELTDKGFQFFLKEIDAKLLKILKQKNCHTSTPLIQPKEIQKIELQFNANFHEEIQKIETLLNLKNFKLFQSQFERTSRMRGITCLLYGPPGCGKTEFVLQLAKKTKRPIMQVQVTDYISKWVGDSETNLKRIFNDYRLQVEKSNVIPILFLNECDQIIGRRINIRDSVDQMNNALQNILLEELETFPGILIGTSNLVENMDPAFERRWIYKIEFEAPDKSTQMKIWQTAIPEIDGNILENITTQFNLSPAQINNVVKRLQIEKIILPEKKLEDQIIQLCKTETFKTSTKTAIGF
jgi:SpoVK/Ycf46/Vps4 family AAA+-type ATPase